MSKWMKILLIVAGVFAFLIVVVLVVFLLTQTGVSRNSTTNATAPITLRYWRVFDDQDTMNGIISEYQKQHPNVTIEYRKFSFADYEKELINALAEDRGPDILSVHNTMVNQYKSKLAPMPEQLKVSSTQVQKQGLGTTVVGTIKTIAGFTPKYIRETFVPAVADDVMFNDEKNTQRIYGLPLSVDTLSLFYNPYLFNSAGIATPPTDWNQFEDDVKKLTVIAPETHEILQSGAAFGAARNIQRAFDILSTLMEQNGTIMTLSGVPTFTQISPYIKDKTINPAAEALRFYTDFAWVTKADVYTWNQDMPDSVEAFAQERAAMMFGYSYHVAQIRTKAPGLKFEIAPLPQKQETLKRTYANYWVEAVSNKSKNQDMAWDFIMFATSVDHVKSYLTATQHPTALRSLIPDQLADDALRPFASQLLIASNWYHGRDIAGAEKAFLDMIDTAMDVKGGSLSTERSQLRAFINRAQQTILQTY